MACRVCRTAAAGIVSREEHPLAPGTPAPPRLPSSHAQTLHSSSYYCETVTSSAIRHYSEILVRSLTTWFALFAEGVRTLVRKEFLTNIDRGRGEGIAYRSGMLSTRFDKYAVHILGGFVDVQPWSHKGEASFAKLSCLVHNYGDVLRRAEAVLSPRAEGPSVSSPARKGGGFKTSRHEVRRTGTPAVSHLRRSFLVMHV